MSLPLEVLFRDECCLVVSKPAGLSTQAPAPHDCLELRVRQWLALQESSGSENDSYLGLPHRLDRSVSGAILFATTRRAARLLSRQFERRQIGKTYWAFAEGNVEPADGAWIDWLRKIPGEPRGELAAADQPDAQQAILRYRKLGASAGISWLEIQLETGRMHQIRIQAAARGHAIVGDALYGSRLHFGPASDEPRNRTIALHSASLSFDHPETKARITVAAPPPTYWGEQGISLYGSSWSGEETSFPRSPHS